MQTKLKFSLVMAMSDFFFIKKIFISDFYITYF